MLNKSILIALASAALLFACSEDETSSTPAPTLAIKVNPTSIAQNGSFHVSLTVTNYTVREPTAEEEAAVEAGTFPSDSSVGHYHLYVDSTDMSPLDADGAELEKDEVLPCALESAIEPGEHKLIARLHGLDHKILLPEVTATAAITVTKGDCSATGNGSASGAGGGSPSGSGGAGGH